jgi:hypothetical protein
VGLGVLVEGGPDRLLDRLAGGGGEELAERHRGAQLGRHQAPQLAARGAALQVHLEEAVLGVEVAEHPRAVRVGPAGRVEHPLRVQARLNRSRQAGDGDPPATAGPAAGLAPVPVVAAPDGAGRHRGRAGGKKSR